MIITNYSWGTELCMQIGLFGMFSLERSAEVSSGGVTAMQLYEEGARLEHSQRYDQPPGVIRPQCVTAGAEQAARCKLATSHSLTRRGGFLRTSRCAFFCVQAAIKVWNYP